MLITRRGQKVFTNRVFEDYYHDVSKFELLTPKEERELLERYKTCPVCLSDIPNRMPPLVCPQCHSPELEPLRQGSFRCLHCKHKVGSQGSPRTCVKCGARRDFAAREQLAVGNLRYVIVVAKRFAKQTPHVIRLISAGNVGLLMAIDRFDLTRKTRLLAYADWWIRKEILDELNAMSVVTIPVHKQKAIRRELKRNQYICLECGLRTDDPTKVPKHTPCTAKEHDFVLACGENTLGGAVVNDDKVTLVSTLDVEDDQLTQEMCEVIRALVYKTPFRERDRFILLRYFDLVGDERRSGPKSLHKVASLLGITPERVRQIKENSLNTLREELRRKNIRGLDSLRVS